MSAEPYYRRVLENVEQSSYDYFDALTHLGRIAYSQQHYDDAVAAFEKAVQVQKQNENESIIDTWFWIARTVNDRFDLTPFGSLGFDPPERARRPASGREPVVVRLGETSRDQGLFMVRPPLGRRRGASP